VKSEPLSSKDEGVFVFTRIANDLAIQVAAQAQPFTHSNAIYMYQVIPQPARWKSVDGQQCRDCEQCFVDEENLLSIFDYDMCSNCAQTSPVVIQMKEEKAQEDYYIDRF